MRRPILACLAALLLALPAAAADWRTEVNAFDRDRLAREAEAFGTAMRAALAQGSAGDVATLADVLSVPAQPIEVSALLGDWRCRTIKLGGPFGALTIYRFFRCRITAAEGVVFFEKLSGSQRVSGVLYPDGEARMVLLGAGHYGDEAPRAYGGPLSAQGPDRDNRDEPGVLTRHGDRVLVGFPWPILESDYDILELRR